ncbi:MAG: hypothetical protein JNJ84_17760 [Rhodobacteraceae bacterium]|nr:hypothetical protein [Paracoccaceae bacterium]
MRDGTRLLLQGEDFDYIRATIRAAHQSSFTHAEVQALVDRLSVMPADKLEALIRELAPHPRDERHLVAARQAQAERKLRAARDAERATERRAERAARAQRETEFLKSLLGFAAFAAIVVVLNQPMIRGDWESLLSEGAGKAAGMWLVAFFLTWGVKRNRHRWLFGVACLVMVVIFAAEPALLAGSANAG